MRVGAENESSTFIKGDLRVDLAARRVFGQGFKKSISRPLEYKLLTTLIKYGGKSLTRDSSQRKVWGPHHLHETHYLRVFMANLRRKIEQDSAQPR